MGGARSRRRGAAAASSSSDRGTPAAAGKGTGAAAAAGPNDGDPAALTAGGWCTGPEGCDQTPIGVFPDVLRGASMQSAREGHGAGLSRRVGEMQGAAAAAAVLAREGKGVFSGASTGDIARAVLHQAAAHSINELIGGSRRRQGRGQDVIRQQTAGGVAAIEEDRLRVAEKKARLDFERRAGAAAEIDSVRLAVAACLARFAASAQARVGRAEAEAEGSARREETNV